MHILSVCRGCYRVKLAKITHFTFWVFLNAKFIHVMLWFSVGLARQTVKASHASFSAVMLLHIHVFTYCCIDQRASRNPLQRVSSVCGIIYWSHTTYLFLFASIFQFLQWFRFNPANSCVIVTTASTCLLLLMKLLFFLSALVKLWRMKSGEGSWCILYTRAAQCANKSLLYRATRVHCQSLRRPWREH